MYIFYLSDKFIELTRYTFLVIYIQITNASIGLSDVIINSHKKQFIFKERKPVIMYL